MLCRCSQQERVIALGVWSSLRRIGSSGQSCQGLPKDSPCCVWGCVCFIVQVCVPLSHRRKSNTMFSSCMCMYSTPSRSHAGLQCVFAYAGAWEQYAPINKHPGVCGGCISSPGLTTASNRPAGTLTVTVESSGPVSSITYALRLLEPSRCLGNNAAIGSLLQACHPASRDTLRRMEGHQESAKWQVIWIKKSHNN